MITRKSRDEIKLMKMAGNIVALVHQEMKNVIQPGISTKELDDIACRIIKGHKAIPTFLGYRGFTGSICASVNEQVVHGIPSSDVILKEGDIIAVDVGATFRGLVGDSAMTYPVGKISKDCEKLLEGTQKALYKAIEYMKEGNTIDEVASQIEAVAKDYGLGIVRNYGGHGVGRSMHEEPFVFNFKTGRQDTVLKRGMTIAIEPMLNLGGDDVYELSDGWTVSTIDGKPSAHFEHSILVTDGEAEILTKLL